MLQKMKNLVREEEGQGLTEYGLIIGLVAVALIAALGLLKEDIAGIFGDIDNKLTEVDGTVDPG